MIRAAGLYGDPLTRVFTDHSAESDPYRSTRAHNSDGRGVAAAVSSLVVEGGESPQISATENFFYDAALQMPVHDPALGGCW